MLLHIIGWLLITFSLVVLVAGIIGTLYQSTQVPDEDVFNAWVTPVVAIWAGGIVCCFIFGAGVACLMI
jgi:uncharacterized membrane protein